MRALSPATKIANAVENGRVGETKKFVQVGIDSDKWVPVVQSRLKDNIMRAHLSSSRTNISDVGSTLIDEEGNERLTRSLRPGGHRHGGHSDKSEPSTATILIL